MGTRSVSAGASRGMTFSESAREVKSRGDADVHVVAEDGLAVAA